MKYVILTICVLLLISATVQAQYDTIPDQTILISNLQDIVFVDTYAVAVTDQGVASYFYDARLGQFVFEEIIFMNVSQSSIKLYGDMVAVQTDYSRLHLIDISALPHLEYLGEIDFGVYFADFAISEEDIYISMWFDGVWRYRLDDLNNAEFIDSSMIGILATQLEVYDQDLYVLDEYNGLLRYDISADGFGEFIDYLYVPRRPSSFIKHDPGFVLTLYDGGAYIGEFFPDGAEITDSVYGIPATQAVYATDSLLAFVCGRELVLTECDDLTNSSYIEAPLIRPYGDLFRVGNHDWLILPEIDGGATMFDLSDSARQEHALYREGQITSMEIFDGRLFLGGVSSPVDVYQIGADSRVSWEYTIYDELDSVALMTHNGDTLLPLYANMNMVGFVSQASSPDSFFLDYAVYAKAAGANDVFYMTEKINDLRVLLVFRDYEIIVCGISDSATLEVYRTWNPSRELIRSVAVNGDAVFIDMGKVDQVKSYKFDSNFDLQEIAGIGLPTASVKLLTASDRLFVVQANTLQVHDISNPYDLDYLATVNLPSAIYDLAVDGNRLYCVGDAGILVYDISENIPVLVQTGGRGAQRVVAGEGIVATAGVDGVFIYSTGYNPNAFTSVPDKSDMPTDFVLGQNYPNPFNMETVIAYNLRRAANVELTVYNVLGQKVITLVDGPQSAGHYVVSWDGTTTANTVVSSGVYFYRLTADDYIGTKKMMLVK
ncbi:MAG: T9SS type A sorting domain-containing protein [Candidatus Zixiibacteriota bacterium]